MRILIVGDLDGHVTLAASMALEKGAKVSHVANPQKALEVLRNGQGADLIWFDINRYPIRDYIQALEQERICVPIIACGVKAQPKAAEQAILDGARDYLPLPPDAELIAAILQVVGNPQKTMVYNSPLMHRLVELVKKVAPSDTTILITGESGTGKEIMAHLIHSLSNRSKKPFIPLNCAAIPENLLESELFGHEKGSFTGALARRIGKFEEAHLGSLLLDEISEMDLRLQVKLLRAVQERVIDRVGGSQPVRVDIRIIATSNQDLRDATRNGKFREDLYYRLNVVNIHLPPLRDRQEDLIPLANHFVKKYCTLNQFPLKTLSQEAQSALYDYHWPGNIRELENFMQRAVLLSQYDEIEYDNIFIQAPYQPISLTQASGVGKTISEVERDLILRTLDHCVGDRGNAAMILGISARTLRNKLKEYGSPLVD
jgi:two-component system response regulator FlrC